MLPRTVRTKLVMEWRARFAAEPESAQVTHQRYGDARREIGLTQDDVAEILGVSQHAVSKWETGQMVPSAQNLLRMSKLYGLPVEQLTGY